MSRETKVGLAVALSFLLLVGGVLGYKLYLTGDPWLSLSDGTNNPVVQNDEQSPTEGMQPDGGSGKPAEPAPDGQDQPQEKKLKKSREEKALAKANGEHTRPTEGPPPTEEPAKPESENQQSEVGRPGEGRPALPPTEAPDKPVTGGPALTPNERPGAVVASGPSGPPPAEELPKLGSPPADKPSGLPPAEELPRLGGPPAPDEAVKPALNERRTTGPPPPEEVTKPNERLMIGSPRMPPPSEEPRPMMEKPGAQPPALPPLPEESTKPQPFNEKPGAQPPPLPPAEAIRPAGPPPAEPPMTSLPLSPTPPAFEAKPGGPPGSPRELAPRLTGPAGSSAMPPESPKDVPPPPAPNTFERKYDVPALGKPEVVRGPNSGTLVSGQQDNRPGIPLTVRPQPGKQGSNQMGGVPVVIQSPTWNTPDGRAPAQVESFEMEVYVMKPGDTYATVSQMRYRSERYQNALSQFNRERDGRLSSPQPGMSVFLPPAGYLERRYGVANPAAPGRGAAPDVSQGWDASTRDKNVQPAGGRTDNPPEAKPVVQAGVSLPPNAKRYRVRANDTIWNIAKTTLGNGERWPDILKLNRDVLPDVNRLQAGMVLRLPDDARVDASETPQ